MEGLVGALALIIGTLLAVGGSMVGLRLLISFVPGPTVDPSDTDTLLGRSEDPARRPAGRPA